MMIKKMSILALSLGLMTAISQAEWGKGFGKEYKTILIPENQQSGWGMKPLVTKVDSDRDGVADENDYCEGTKAGTKVDSKGCPLTAKAVPDKNWTLQGIKFETGSARIEPESLASLDEAAEILTTHTRVVVEVQGHTDNVGVKTDNQSLSEKRAQAVQQYLVEKGVKKERVEAKGYGDTIPVASNDSVEGRSQNRRIQFKVINR